MPPALIEALATLFIQSLPYIEQEIGVITLKGKITPEQWTAFKTAVDGLTQDPAWTVTEPDV